MSRELAPWLRQNLTTLDRREKLVRMLANKIAPDKIMCLADATLSPRRFKDIYTMLSEERFTLKDIVGDLPRDDDQFSKCMGQKGTSSEAFPSVERRRPVRAKK